MNSYITIGIVAFVVLFVIYYIKISIDEKKGINSEEKQKIRAIVDEVVPDGETCTVVYATREDFSLGGSGRTITTTTEYYYYALAFKPGELYLVPLFIEDDEISYGDFILYNKENLGKIEVKKGYLKLFDKDKKEICGLYVVESNTKDDEYNPVNIQQKEETEAFWIFAREFMQEVNSEN